MLCPHHRRAPLSCGLLSAQKWRFAARLLGAAGRCSQSVACSPGLQSSSGKLSSRGETNKKTPVSHTEAALWHICFLFTTGLRSSLRRGMTERKVFRNRASGKQNYCCFMLCIFFFPGLNAIFSRYLLVVDFSLPFVLLCLWVLCPVLLHQYIPSETQENCYQQQALWIPSH